MKKEDCEKLLTILGKRLREGEDALHALRQMEELPESSFRASTLKGAEKMVSDWAEETVKQIQELG